MKLQKKILIYFENSVRNIFFESFVEELIGKGHEVHMLTKCERGVLHNHIESLGAVTIAYSPKGPKAVQFFKHIKFLVIYSRKNKIDIIYSHLQLANLIALLAQYFIRAKVLPCRHHVDEVKIVGNKVAVQIDKWVNRLSGKIIVVSKAAKEFMITREHLKPHKVMVIPLGYNFNRNYKPDFGKIESIRSQMRCNLLLIVISRMTKHKRHIIALETLNRLVKEGFDVKMILLDQGGEKPNLEAYVQKNQLANKVLFAGFVNNIMDYASAAELLLLPSIIESSNQVVRELAHIGKTCIVCSGIGDFDEYIEHGKNGFLVSKENTADEMFQIIKEYYNKKEELVQMGAQLQEKVYSKFGIATVADQYLMAAEPA
jgi:glycosyltransferase involved in cell wall biosynthesis